MEMVAFRIGTARLKKLGIGMDEEGTDGHGSHAGAHAGHISGPEGPMVADQNISAPDTKNANGAFPDNEKGIANIEEAEAYRDSSTDSPAIAQILGVAILECGVILHSLIIGM